MKTDIKIKDSILVPVILCGGSGSRLWPLSRESYPKQFISLNSNKNDSLLQKTLLRINELNNLRLSGHTLGLIELEEISLQML